MWLIPIGGGDRLVFIHSGGWCRLLIGDVPTRNLSKFVTIIIGLSSWADNHTTGLPVTIDIDAVKALLPEAYTSATLAFSSWRPLVWWPRLDPSIPGSLAGAISLLSAVRGGVMTRYHSISQAVTDILLSRRPIFDTIHSPPCLCLIWACLERDSVHRWVSAISLASWEGASAGGACLPGGPMPAATAVPAWRRRFCLPSAWPLGTWCDTWAYHTGLWEEGRPLTHLCLESPATHSLPLLLWVHLFAHRFFSFSGWEVPFSSSLPPAPPLERCHSSGAWAGVWVGGGCRSTGGGLFSPRRAAFLLMPLCLPA